jgi:hypothetical protein
MSYTYLVLDKLSNSNVIDTLQKWRDKFVGVPPIMNGIKRLKRKEKSSYQARDLWTHEDDAVFLNTYLYSRL